MTGLAIVPPVLMELTPGMVSSNLASDMAPPFSMSAVFTAADCCNTEVCLRWVVTTALCIS